MKCMEAVHTIYTAIIPAYSIIIDAGQLAGIESLSNKFD